MSPDGRIILEPLPLIPVRFKRDPPAFCAGGRRWREGELRAGSRVALPEPEAARFILEGIATYHPWGKDNG
jgi:hypothetical protein